MSLKFHGRTRVEFTQELQWAILCDAIDNMKRSLRQVDSYLALEALKQVERQLQKNYEYWVGDPITPAEWEDLKGGNSDEE